VSDNPIQDWFDNQVTRRPPTPFEVLGAFPSLARELGIDIGDEVPEEPWTIHTDRT